MCLRIGAKNWTARPHKGILIRSCGASLEWGKADKNGVKKEREWPGNNWRKKSLSEENPLTLGREVRDLRKERWISGFQVPCFICDQAQFSHWAMSGSLWPHGLPNARPPCLSPAPGAYSNSCPSIGDAIQPSHSLSSPLLLPSIFPSIGVFSNESVLRIRWPKSYVIQTSKITSAFDEPCHTYKCSEYLV